MDIFPVPASAIATGFTTGPPASHHQPANIVVVPLGDKELGVHRVTAATTHTLAKPPLAVPGGDETTKAWEAVFPAGSINPGNKTAPPGGFGFYLRGPPAFAESLNRLGGEEHAEVVFSYDVLFEHGFEWVKGGKLPGVYGGAGDYAYGCTGGRQTDRCKCFNLRLMWREGGKGELYTYIPQVDSNTKRLLSVPPKSIQHPDYGFSVGRGAWTFTPGKWTRVTERVKMNKVGHEDGEIQLHIDGRSVLHVTGLVLRTKEGPDARVQGLHVQTFFGGHAPDWASPKDQKAWFANISGAILKSHVLHDEL